jgi:hypothetical protein
VYFFVKEDLPEDHTSEASTDLIRHLAKMGIDINEYTDAQGRI